MSVTAGNLIDYIPKGVSLISAVNLTIHSKLNRKYDFTIKKGHHISVIANIKRLNRV